MNLIPYPEDLPKPLRKLGHIIMSPDMRAKVIHSLHWAAQYQTFFTRAYHENQASLNRLHNIHKGQTCVIMGNGPSLANTEPKLLRNVICFGLNRGYLLWKKWDFLRIYFVAVNDLLIEQFSKEIAELKCPKFIPWRYRNLFSRVENCLFIPQIWHHNFSDQPAKGLWAGGTVTFTAMQLAYFLGFKKVILIGVDHSFETKGECNKEVVSQGSDPNHFDENYFGEGIRWNLPDLPLSERAYNMARIAFELDGREIVNATDGGKLEIFRRESLQQALATRE